MSEIELASQKGDKKRQEMTQSQTRFVSALLVYGNVIKAADVVGISERTARRYMSDPIVRQRLLAAQQELLEAACRKALATLDTALQALEDVMSDRFSPQSRVTAAKAVLEHATKLYESAVLAERVRQLEQRVLEVLNENR
jgi:phage terminase small subunit